MSNEKNNGGTAFPVNGNDIESANDIIQDGNGGMTLRDYFAAKAMNGICANPEVSISMDEKVPHADVLGIKAYAIADAMLKAREQST